MKTLIILTYLAFAQAACREYGLWTPTFGQWFFDLCPYDLCDEEGFQKYNPGCDPNHIFAYSTYTIPYRSAKPPATWTLEDSCTPVLQLNGGATTTPTWTTKIILSSSPASTASTTPDDVAEVTESSGSLISTLGLAGTKTSITALTQQDIGDILTTTALNLATDLETIIETSVTLNSITSIDLIATTATVENDRQQSPDTSSLSSSLSTAADSTATDAPEASTSQTSTQSSTSHVITTISSTLPEETSTITSTFTSSTTSTLTSMTAMTESTSTTLREPIRPTASCYDPSDDYITIGDEQAEYAAEFCNQFAGQVYKLDKNLHCDNIYSTGNGKGYYFEIGVDNSCEYPAGGFSLPVGLCISKMHSNWEDCKFNKGQGGRYTLPNCLVLNYKPTHPATSTATTSTPRATTSTNGP